MIEPGKGQDGGREPLTTSAKRLPSPFLRRAVLLRHECGTGSHFDWMMEDPAEPANPAGPLLTWRTAEPSWRWAELGRIEMEQIGAHRRDYLVIEGELSGGRGTVHRVDEGTATAHRWTEDGGLVDLHLHHFRGTVTMQQTGGKTWELRVI